jgi:RNA polymerase sigma factor (sigma-70 family)
VATLFDTEDVLPEARERPATNSLTQDERNELVASCDRTCKSEARKATLQSSGRHEFDDLLQEAYIACIGASKRWLPDVGVQFNSYATACVRRHLKNLISHGRTDDVRVEDWDTVKVWNSDATSPRALTPDEERVIGQMKPETARIIRLIVAERLTPQQVAEQIERPVKDVKLIIRNSIPKVMAETKRQPSLELWQAFQDEAWIEYLVTWLREVLTEAYAGGE